MDETLATALGLAAAGDPGAAAAAERAAGQGSLLGAALVEYLARTSGTIGVYAAPEAFQAFIREGGNVGLYTATSAALAGCYDQVRTLLDIGCGDGLALVPALQQAGTYPREVELVEPSGPLLRQCRERVAALGVRLLGPDRPRTLDQALAQDADGHWDLAEATFALHTIEPAARSRQLAALAERVRRIVLAEFDVHLPPPGTPAHLSELAARYEKGLAEYHDSRPLVAQGFLLPVLLGQLAPDAPRANWEQPVADWAAQLHGAGFTDVEVRLLHSYWWAPAVLITATGRSAGQ